MVCIFFKDQKVTFGNSDTVQTNLNLKDSLNSLFDESRRHLWAEKRAIHGTWYTAFLFLEIKLLFVKIEI